MAAKIVDEYTDRTDMTPQQKWRARHPGYNRRNYLREKDARKEAREKNVKAFDDKIVKARVKRLYGLTLEEYRELQTHDCEICGGRTKHMHIDHSVDGSYHGVLCSNCNRAIGHLHHDVDKMLRAVEYVKRTRGRVRGV